MTQAVKCERCEEFKEEEGQTHMELPDGLMWGEEGAFSGGVHTGSYVSLRDKKDKKMHVCSKCAKELEKRIGVVYKEWKKGE